MSRLQFEIEARRQEMYSDLISVPPDMREPTEYERVVFDRYQLSEDARRIAIYSSRRSGRRAWEIYRTIAESL